MKSRPSLHLCLRGGWRAVTGALSHVAVGWRYFAVTLTAGIAGRACVRLVEVA